MLEEEFIYTYDNNEDAALLAMDIRIVLRLHLVSLVLVICSKKFSNSNYRYASCDQNC